MRRENDEWEKFWLPKLRAAAIEADFPEISNGSYFTKKVSCVFLKDRECGIYDIRPAACRLHYVTTPREQCSPDAPKVQVQAPDFRQLEQLVWNVSRQILEESFDGNMDLLAGPLALMVLAVSLILLKNDPHQADVLQACKGLLTPAKWMQRMISNKVKRAAQ